MEKSPAFWFPEVGIPAFGIIGLVLGVRYTVAYYVEIKEDR